MARAMGRYELLRPLARGGMAEVFLARRRSAGVEKLLVIKRIRAERAGNARFLELFVREARLSMSLAHQNIVPVFDFGRIGEQVFLAMERVEGRDLGSTLARDNVTPLTPVVAAFVAAECCRALAYAHDRRGVAGEKLGVVHRDVTPRNVLLSWSGEVKLTDFGIASLSGEDTGRLVGTPAYMAPEQARGEAVDARSDLYALGLVLREAATGVRARPGDREAQLAAARSNTLAACAGIPDALVAIIDRATATSPADRYPDARTMLAALDEFIVAERAGARGESPDRKLADWLARAWEGVTEEDTANDQPIETADVESMFEDGEDVGTQTERSLAATVDDPMPGDSLSRRVPAEATQPVRKQSPQRWGLLVALLVIVAGGAFAAMRFTRATSTPDAAIPVVAPDAFVGVDSPPDVMIDAAIDAPIDALELDASIAVVRPPPRDARAPTPRDAAVAVDASTLAKRKVRINALPWATFTVDGGTTQHETISTVMLVPGKHKIRFKNPELGVEREITIDVPPDRDLDHVEDLRR